ncbi:MAG TPA: YicC/YloC family endoribonuclease [Dinghuibacter sp.]|uniref:YicC/YloC family endoribonuclease n=1 Tax=Dinghuibacter sp. TaxID=2024697 RepID=UPI002C757AC7|nr:YicC/YloC family endoribonuclease [Dinghuibacter sp.]HTJ13972.1 YicC/YloC family endoribonuclease [Dinghuibacter sp.]
MLKSMTGFGRTEQSIGDKTFLIDIRSLNGKQFELQLKMPAILKPFEFDIRNILSERLLRGTIDCQIFLKQNGGSKPVTINTELAKSYFKPLESLATELNLDTAYTLSALLKLPDVITPSTEVLTEAEWEGLKKVVGDAVIDLDRHRMDEGAVLERDLLARVDAIRVQQDKVIELEPLRKQKTREGLLKLLEEHVGAGNFDANRLEQELIYYIEKMDISEEQVRLKNHCDYFRSIILEDGEISKGKKLSFILQEIGREINTTGSKAYDSTIQKCVVLMKDELEKAKEQILNVL